ncbi:uncharacterized protein [Engystomops pustulosus]|uniref:uncharacterized protein n=1 Tax=Engystomops pustulosus TaxID=76066 RepID=UPI003AFA8797
MPAPQVGELFFQGSMFRFRGLWSHSMSRASSNERELKAVLKTLETCTKDVKGKNLKIFSDNTTTVAYLKRQGGTRSKKLQNISQKIFSWAEENALSISAVHLRGSENEVADYLSRTPILPHEWSLKSKVFQEIVLRWGNPAKAGSRPSIHPSQDSRPLAPGTSLTPEPRVPESISLDPESAFLNTKGLSFKESGDHIAILRMLRRRSGIS